MKRQLRISGLYDYIAVDIVNEKGIILSTPLYIAAKGMGKIKYKDEEDKISRITNIFPMNNGGKLTHLLCKDTDGFEFDIQFNELLESHVQFI